jgi:hypothetical protein
VRRDEFIDTVAHRGGAGFVDAMLRAHAVPQAPRDAVGELEFLDVTDQLPDNSPRVY